MKDENITCNDCVYSEPIKQLPAKNMCVCNYSHCYCEISIGKYCKLFKKKDIK